MSKNPPGGRYMARSPNEKEAVKDVRASFIAIAVLEGVGSPSIRR